VVGAGGARGGGGKKARGKGGKAALEEEEAEVYCSVEGGATLPQARSNPRPVTSGTAPRSRPDTYRGRPAQRCLTDFIFLSAGGAPVQPDTAVGVRGGPVMLLGTPLTAEEEDPSGLCKPNATPVPNFVAVVNAGATREVPLAPRPPPSPVACTCGCLAVAVGRFFFL
jgi:hypothetical protein